MNVRFGFGSDNYSPLVPGSNPGFIFKGIQKESWEDGISYKLVFSKPGGKEMWARIPRIFTRKKDGDLRPVYSVNDNINDILNFILNLTSQFCGVSEMEKTIGDSWKETNEKFKQCITGNGGTLVVTDETLWEQSVQEFYDDLIQTMVLCLEAHEGVEGNLLLHYNDKGFLCIPLYAKDTCTLWNQGKKGGSFPDWNSSQSIFLTQGEHILEGTRLVTIKPNSIEFAPAQEVGAVETDAW